MSILVNIHRTHRHYTGGRATVGVQGQTIGECLGALVDRYPALRKILFDQKGALRRHFEIYLNGESAYPGELARPVSDGDEIHITALLSGG